MFCRRSNRLPVTESIKYYDRSARIDGLSVQISGDKNQDTFSDAELGKTERVDLALSGDIPSSTIAGKVHYDGKQTGPILVEVFTDNGFSDDALFDSVTLDGDWNYAFTDVPAGDYNMRYFRDSDGNGTMGSAEAQGIFETNPVQLPSEANNIDILLIDPDVDGDGLPDWWELQYFGNLSHGLNDDSDSDGRLNDEEYANQTNPASKYDQTSTLLVYPGWNFVSISVEPEDTSAKTFLAQHNFIRQVVDWNGTHYTQANLIIPKVGYWMYSDKETTFVVQGKFSEDSSVHLYNGWNLVGFDAERLSPVKSEILGFIWWWDAKTAQFRYVGEDSLQPGKGYWIYATEDVDIPRGE